LSRLKEGIPKFKQTEDMDVGNMKYSCRDEVYIDTRDLYTQT